MRPMNTIPIHSIQMQQNKIFATNFFTKTIVINAMFTQQRYIYVLCDFDKKYLENVLNFDIQQTT